MTIASETNKSGPYFGNGVTTVFSYGFKIDDETYLRVISSTLNIETDLVLGTDYFVGGVGNENGGTISVVVPPGANTSLTLARNVPFVQELDLQNQGAFYAETVERAFDLATARDQQLAEQLERTIRLPISVDPADLDTLIAGLIWMLQNPDTITILADGSVVDTKISNITGAQNAILNKLGGLSKREQTLTNIERSQIILNTGFAPATAPQGRLSLIDGVAYSESNVAGATNIYYLPVQGSYVPIWDGTGFIARWFGDGLVLPLSNQGAAFNIDLYVTIIDGTLRLVSGSNWTTGGGGNTARGTGVGSSELEMLNGILVNKYAQTVTYGPGLTANMPVRSGTLVGTFRPRVTGTAEDSERFRLLSNVYNAISRPLITPQIYALTHIWSANSWHTVNAETEQYFAFLQAVSGRPVSARCALRVGSSGATARFADVGIGVDSAAFENATSRSQGTVTISIPDVPTAEYRGMLGTGYHELWFLERGGGADVQTWSGNFGASRLSGECIN